MTYMSRTDSFTTQRFGTKIFSQKNCTFSVTGLCFIKVNPRFKFMCFYPQGQATEYSYSYDL